MSWLRHILPWLSGPRTGASGAEPEDAPRDGSPEDAEDGSVEDDPEEDASPEVVEMTIDGELDLHTFSPKETRDVVRDYIDAAHERGLREIRVVHGKGIGVQRRIVHAVLEEHPLVLGFRQAGESRGGWGATLVDLVPQRDDAD